MRVENKLEIGNKEINFIEMFYLDGPKLEISLDEKIIAVWYDEDDKYETWFLIKVDAFNFNCYISNTRSLLDVMKTGSISKAKRYYNDYYKFDDIELIDNILEYDDLPTDKSFLGFNYAAEINPFVKVSTIERKTNIWITDSMTPMVATIGREAIDLTSYKVHSIQRTEEISLGFRRKNVA